MHFLLIVDHFSRLIQEDSLSDQGLILQEGHSLLLNQTLQHQDQLDLDQVHQEDPSQVGDQPHLHLKLLHQVVHALGQLRDLQGDLFHQHLLKVHLLLVHDQQQLLQEDHFNLLFLQLPSPQDLFLHQVHFQPTLVQELPSNQHFHHQHSHQVQDQILVDNQTDLETEHQHKLLVAQNNLEALNLEILFLEVKGAKTVSHRLFSLPEMDFQMEKELKLHKAAEEENLTADSQVVQLLL